MKRHGAGEVVNFGIMRYNKIRNLKGNEHMKLKDGFLLSEIAGQTVVVPTKDDMDLNMMIRLNGTGAFLWGKLQEDVSEEALVSALLDEYEVDEATARRCVKAFVENLKENGFIDG